MILSGAEILIKCLLEQGVDTVFGYPGGSVLYIYDMLYKYSGSIRHITVSHEQSAAHAADGYARASGKVGVCLATSGPGATNLVTGIATAYMDSVPLVAITGNVPVPMLGRDSFQEVDIAGIVMPVTKYSCIVKNIDELADTLRLAFYIAQEGRPGPVLIDIPKDVTCSTAEFEPDRQMKDQRHIHGMHAAENEIAHAAELINNAKRPLIFAGGGVIRANAWKQLRVLADRLNAPVCTSIMGKGAENENDSRSLGIIGMHGSPASAKAMEECDLVIALGTRFSDRVATDRKSFAANADIIQIDIDPAEMGKNIECNLYLVGDINEILAQILQKTDGREESKWLKGLKNLNCAGIAETAKREGYIRPHKLFEVLNRTMAAQDILVTDVGQHQMWAAQFYKTENARGFITSGGLGTMGFGMGAAIGAKLAEPASKVVLVTGDGGFRMDMAEIQTAVSEKLDLTIVLMNNGVLGMVRQWQHVFCGDRFAATELKSDTDYVKLAEALGARGYTADRHESFSEIMHLCMQGRGVNVIECKVSSEEYVLPMIPEGKPYRDIILSI